MTHAQHLPQWPCCSRTRCRSTITSAARSWAGPAAGPAAGRRLCKADAGLAHPARSAWFMCHFATHHPWCTILHAHRAGSTYTLGWRAGWGGGRDLSSGSAATRQVAPSRSWPRKGRLPPTHSFLLSVCQLLTRRLAGRLHFRVHLRAAGGGVSTYNRVKQASVSVIEPVQAVAEDSCPPPTPADVSM